ncbi:MAG: glutaredoxin family protein [Candidatus Pacebacteria bacterium]|nr:glutaredoxin family protein [Candidatus Paceibacterota bacterium]MBP9772264.1 glutaredoxin family protein [Candidatus Paceibacterota bacterium]
MSLINFYGEECPHCQHMHTVVEKLEKEEGIKVEKIEVWHNKENLKKLEDLDKGVCGGVPFFINTDSGKTICGEAEYEALKAWAKGE